MPFDQEHLLLAWNGELTSGAPGAFVTEDQFAGSIRFIGPGVAGGQTTEALDALTEVLRTYWADTAAYIPQRAILQTVKWNRIGTDGKYASRTDTTLAANLNQNGTASMIYPPQIAWCTTWTTQNSRGRASKGRTFWPTGVPIGNSTFRPAESLQQAKANRDALLINQLNVAATAGAGGQLRAAVMSLLGTGASSPIEGTRVGDRLDVQRRRGEQMGERYLAGVAPPA
jgi:hypothetical protein